MYCAAGTLQTLGCFHHLGLVQNQALLRSPNNSGAAQLARKAQSPERQRGAVSLGSSGPQSSFQQCLTCLVGKAGPC